MWFEAFYQRRGTKVSRQPIKAMLTWMFCTSPYWLAVWTGLIYFGVCYDVLTNVFKTCFPTAMATAFGQIHFIIKQKTYNIVSEINKEELK